MRSLAVIVLAAATVLAAQDVHVRVARDSHGTTSSKDDFPTIQMALDHAPLPTRGGRLYLHIYPGVYQERVFVSRHRTNTSFIGMGTDSSQVVIQAAQNAKSAGGTFFSQTVEVLADNFSADNITFANSAGNTGQAVAVAVHADRAIFKHCRFLGDQDTLFADFGRQYYLDSYIEGGVDFIFGNAAAVFDGGEIHIIRPGYLTAQSRVEPNQNTGFVFRNVHITAAQEVSAKGFYLGRPWRPYSRVVFIHSEMPDALRPEGWTPWRAGETPANTFYAEQGSTGPGAHPEQRVPWSHQLSSRQAQTYAPAIFLRGTDRWNPEVEAARLP